MDPDGAFLNIFQHATTPDELARDIRAHLK